MGYDCRASYSTMCEFFVFLAIDIFEVAKNMERRIGFFHFCFSVCLRQVATWKAKTSMIDLLSLTNR